MLFSRKCVWVAGSAGSLGSEICRQIPVEDYELLKQIWMLTLRI